MKFFSSRSLSLLSLLKFAHTMDSAYDVQDIDYKEPVYTQNEPVYNENEIEEVIF